MDPTLSPVKGIARVLGIRLEEVTLQKVFEHIQVTQHALRRQLYSTQNESDIGRKLLADLCKKGEHEVIPAVAALNVPKIDMPLEVEIIELLPNMSITSTTYEDTYINAPLFNHLLRQYVSPLVQLKLTVGYSSFIDCKGREQCCSMVLLNGSFHVVTMLLGKEDLLKEYPALLGQARRRAAAILSAQPWRQRVDIILYDLQHIAVFRLDSTLLYDTD